MTREEDLRRLLNDAATEIPAGNAPIAGLVREGRRSKKLRHIVQAASVTAAVAVIAVGAFIVGPSIGGSGNLTAQPTASPSELAVQTHPPGKTRERMCVAGEYPVWSVRYPETGGACVPEGDQPPPGYATYPPGLVPEYFDEVVTCSPTGKCVEGPLAIKCPHTYPAEPCRIAGRSLPSP
jgi:hypothetical protein